MSASQGFDEFDGSFFGLRSNSESLERTLSISGRPGSTALGFDVMCFFASSLSWAFYYRLSSSSSSFSTQSVRMILILPCLKSSIRLPGIKYTKIVYSTLNELNFSFNTLLISSFMIIRLMQSSEQS